MVKFGLPVFYHFCLMVKSLAFRFSYDSAFRIRPNGPVHTRVVWYSVPYCTGLVCYLNRICVSTLALKKAELFKIFIFRSRIEEKICCDNGQIDAGCFDEALQLVVRVLHMKYVQKFINSQLFKNYITELMATIASAGEPNFYRL